MEGHQAVLSVAIPVRDIRGFSSMAEKLTERELAQIIGNWFRDIGNAVQSAGGIIDKYIGDALLAYWPARDQQGTECAICLDVALTILQTRRQSHVARHRDAIPSWNRGPFRSCFEQ